MRLICINNEQVINVEKIKLYFFIKKTERSILLEQFYQKLLILKKVKNTIIFIFIVLI